MQTMTLDAEELRAAMRAWTSGVAIVTAAFGGHEHGMTVSSFTSISLDPPLIVISLQKTSRTREMVTQAGSFGVTILAADQQELSERFANRPAGTDHGLDGLETEKLATGAPFIKGGLAWLDCRVSQMVPVGMNTLFIGEVVAVHVDERSAPLIYHHRTYRQLQE